MRWPGSHATQRSTRPQDRGDLEGHGGGHATPGAGKAENQNHQSHGVECVAGPRDAVGQEEPTELGVGSQIRSAPGQFVCRSPTAVESRSSATGRAISSQRLLSEVVDVYEHGGHVHYPRSCLRERCAMAERAGGAGVARAAAHADAARGRARQAARHGLWAVLPGLPRAGRPHR